MSSRIINDRAALLAGFVHSALDRARERGFGQAEIDALLLKLAVEGFGGRRGWRSIAVKLRRLADECDAHAERLGEARAA